MIAAVTSVVLGLLAYDVLKIIVRTSAVTFFSPKFPPPRRTYLP